MFQIFFFYSKLLSSYFFIFFFGNVGIEIKIKTNSF